MITRKCISAGGKSLYRRKVHLWNLDLGGEGKNLPHVSKEEKIHKDEFKHTQEDHESEGMK